jgi:hypothetical protein
LLVFLSPLEVEEVLVGAEYLDYVHWR